jgi:hypothetical protein
MSPEVSGKRKAINEARRFINPKIIPRERTEAFEITTNGEIRAPILDEATHTACPIVLISVEYNSGVETHVAFYKNKFSAQINSN